MFDMQDISNTITLFMPILKNLWNGDTVSHMVLYLLISPIFLILFTLISLTSNKLRSTLRIINTIIISLHIIIFQMLLNTIFKDKDLQFPSSDFQNIGFSIIDNHVLIYLKYFKIIDINIILNYSLYLCIIVFVYQLYSLFFKQKK